MTGITDKKQQVYRNVIKGTWREAETCYAVDRSDNDRYIELEFLYPYQKITTEIYREEGFSIYERIQTIQHLMIGIYFCLDWAYCNGNAKMYKGFYENAIKKFRGKKNPKQVEKMFRKNFANKMLDNFNCKHVSINLRRQIDKLLREILREGKFEYRCEYPISSVKNTLLFRNNEEIDLDSILLNIKYNEFLELEEEIKTELYIEMNEGNYTEYNEFLEEWWEENYQKKYN